MLLLFANPADGEAMRPEPSPGQGPTQGTPPRTPPSAQQPHLPQPTLPQPQRQALTVQLPPGQALVHGTALRTAEELPSLLQYVLSDLLPLAPNGLVMGLSSGGGARQGVAAALAGLQLLPLLDGTVAEFQPAVTATATARPGQQGLGARTSLYLPANDVETFLLRSCGESAGCGGNGTSLLLCPSWFQSTCTLVPGLPAAASSWMLPRLRLALLSADSPNNPAWLVCVAFGWCFRREALSAAHAEETPPRHGRHVSQAND